MGCLLSTTESLLSKYTPLIYDYSVFTYTVKHRECLFFTFHPLCVERDIVAEET